LKKDPYFYIQCFNQGSEKELIITSKNLSEIFDSEKEVIMKTIKIKYKIIGLLGALLLKVQGYFC